MDNDRQKGSNKFSERRETNIAKFKSKYLRTEKFQSISFQSKWRSLLWFWLSRLPKDNCSMWMKFGQNCQIKKYGANSLLFVTITNCKFWFFMIIPLVVKKCSKLNANYGEELFLLIMDILKAN